MCFIKNYNRKDECKKPKIAKKNILVYKVIGKNGDGCYRNLYITNEKGQTNREPWKRGFQYTELTPFKSAVHKDLCVIVEGDAFHSKKTKYSALDIKGYDEIVVRMIIPKGALYYENIREYVSSSLIFPISIKDYISDDTVKS